VYSLLAVSREPLKEGAACGIGKCLEETIGDGMHEQNHN
jgi:hypothetical protein